MQIHTAATTHCELGEAPLWHPIEQRLYWTDITRGRLYAFDPLRGEHELLLEGRPIGGLTWQADGSLLLFRDRGRVDVYRDGKTVATVLEEIPEEVDSRFNDVIAAPCGRVFCGTMPTSDRPGRLYRLERDGSYHAVLEGIGCPNGMGFTAELKQMYFTDSTEHTIWVHDYDQDTGRLDNRRVFARTEAPVMPDGLTVDAEGNVWSAMWNGSSIVSYDGDGTIRRSVDLPTPRITSVAFGGEDLSDLYVTSAAGEGQTAQSEQRGGNLFCIRHAATGRREFPSRIGL